MVVHSLRLMISLQSTMTWGWWTNGAAVLADWRWSIRKSGDRWAPGTRGVWRRQLCCADSSTVAPLLKPVKCKTRLNFPRGAFTLLVTALNERWWTVGQWRSGFPLPLLKWSAQVKIAAALFLTVHGTRFSNTNLFRQNVSWTLTTDRITLYHCNPMKMRLDSWELLAYFFSQIQDCPLFRCQNVW